MGQWEENARFCEKEFGVFVDWEERFYICPECEEPVYECDWSEDDLFCWICPICEFFEEK